MSEYINAYIFFKVNENFECKFIRVLTQVERGNFCFCVLYNSDVLQMLPAR